VAGWAAAGPPFSARRLGLVSERALPTAKIAALESILRTAGSVLVAFSGGADSAFLLAAAVRVLGFEDVVAATAVSASLPAVEQHDAARFAAALGVRHVFPATNEMSRPGYAANSGDRCYFCKAELLDVLAPLARELGLAHVATGTNADDARAGFRPGIRAAAERDALTPLLDAGFTKDEVRRVSRDWGLSTWDKPAAACLSSRIAYGVAVTPQRLARVERAELSLRSALAGAGIAVHDLRVRDLGDRARVELDRDLVEVVADRPELLDLSEFDAVELDPRGFRSGSMNEQLSRPDTYR
jgi:pyridinium-3,5-biscarboxylic acid mononucleotide sulfurtransferase